MTRALPQRYRQARNIDDGYEVRINCLAHDGAEEWATVVSALEILSPVHFVTLTLAPVDKSMGCWSEDVHNVHPSEPLWSRRPAKASR